MKAPALLIVRATIEPEYEQAFNEWYNTTHVPDMVRLSGCRSARRYQVLGGDDTHQYMAMYEFDSEEQLRGFMKSEGAQWLLREYDAAFGAVSTRVRTIYQQVYPPPSP